MTDRDAFATGIRDSLTEARATLLTPVVDPGTAPPALVKLMMDAKDAQTVAWTSNRQFVKVQQAAKLAVQEAKLYAEEADKLASQASAALFAALGPDRSQV